LQGATISNLAFDFRGLRSGLDLLDGATYADFEWRYDGQEHHSEFSGQLSAENLADVLVANGFAANLESESAEFNANVDWPGSPAFFAASALTGALAFEIENGRFLQDSGGPGALKFISILNFDALMRRLRFSDDLLRSGLAYDDIDGTVTIQNGLVEIQDRLTISGPSSLYQVSGLIDLAEETIDGEMSVTLPVSNNIPWLGLLTANIPLAVGAFIFDRIFGDQVDDLTSAVYTLKGPWEGLEPSFKQAFGSAEASGAGTQ